MTETRKNLLQILAALYYLKLKEGKRPLCYPTLTSKTLEIPENIELMFIPPYTPELNPIEQIWKEIREKGFANEVFPTLEHVINRLCETINNLTKEVVKSICARKWLTRQYQNL